MSAMQKLQVYKDTNGTSTRGEKLEFRKPEPLEKPRTVMWEALPYSRAHRRPNAAAPGSERTGEQRVKPEDDREGGKMGVMKASQRGHAWGPLRDEARKGTCISVPTPHSWKWGDIGWGWGSIPPDNAKVPRDRKATCSGCHMEA